MHARRSLVALGCAVIGLAASVASLVDFWTASAAFCAESGCATVRESAWARPLGVPMPLLGVAFFASAIALSFIARPGLRRALAVAGGLWAIALIAVQAFAIGAWCKLCLIADPAAIGYAIAVLAGASTLRFTPVRGLAAIGGAAAALAALALWTHAPSTAPPGGEVPAFVAAERVPGIVSVVEVVDFECPFCRRMQERLAAALAQTQVPVRVVRKMLPLGMHPHATPAAIAYCCAEAQGKGEEMAAALFAAAPEELTPEGCEQLAVKVGCDLSRYRADLARAEARVAADAAQVRAAGIRSLPTVFIGDYRLTGAGASTAQLVSLIATAAR